MDSYFIHLTGIVQGVGFRPKVYDLAIQNNLKGTVANSAAGVEIYINADEQQAEKFYQLLLNNLPIRSKVVHHSMQMIEYRTFTDFNIIPSEDDQYPTALLSSDFALCESCRSELHNTSDRRYHYAFITCTQCGPRYSITRKLPYDRINTTMSVFDMCDDCTAEYHQTKDRRFYSQTNSCEKCGIKTSLSVEKAVELIQEGKTIAVKGIGGYLLLCDATNEQAIKTLRHKKARPTKPLAVLYPNEIILKGDVILSPQALQSLKSEVAPIVLTPVLSHPTSGIKTQTIAPGLSSLGVMLPNAPLLELIASAVNKPLIATSANVSHLPIIYKDNDAIEHLSSLADAILVHNRDILVPQDDSVIRFTQEGFPIVIRRSRGMAPSFFSGIHWGNKTVLAMGAQLKSTVTLLHHGNVYISQYAGDLESMEAESNYRTIINHLLDITQAKPEIIIIDKHPSYTSSIIGRELAIQYNATIQEVQHHMAHFAAVTAECNVNEKVMGVIWDGIGLGDDQAFWGGEFFIWNQQSVTRADHFQYFPLLLGDKMAREPRLSALALTPDEFKSSLSDLFTDTEWKVYNALLRTEENKTSSVGRLFDAVAAWCGIASTNSYEGEAAMLLEELASSYHHEHPEDFNPFENINDVFIALQQGVPAKQVAFQFHCTLADIIRKTADKHKIRSLAFSGGVFQNALLVTLICKQFNKTFRLYFHQQLSPNDECISFGQLAYSQWMNRPVESTHNQTTYVPSYSRKN